MHSADVIEVGLPSLPQAEAELLVCDLRLVLAEALKNATAAAPITLPAHLENRGQ